MLNAVPLNVAPFNSLGTAAQADCMILADSPLGGPALVLFNDFTQSLGDEVTVYVVDLVTPDGLVRVPISSWQATLQTGASNYVQCVIPACTTWVEVIESATEFIISRRAMPPGLDVIEYEMARAPVQRPQYDRGPARHTCTLSGYAAGFAEDEDPSDLFDRVLTGIRSTSTGQGTRVRCAVDWLLRPGQRAFVGDESFVVDYINYYVPEFDAYMDVGARG